MFQVGTFLARASTTALIVALADAVSPAQTNFVRPNAVLVQRLGEANEALEN